MKPFFDVLFVSWERVESLKLKLANQDTAIVA
jgi:hypothetical protein